MNNKQNKITSMALSQFYKTTGILLLAAFNASAVDYYISPTGSDTTGDGSSSSPWQTLQKARDAARTVSRPLTEDINIILKNGTYELSSTLSLSAVDSGSASYKVTYRAENAGQATISGGSVVTGWSDANNDGIWQASVAANVDSRLLIVDGNRAIRARSTDGSGWSRNSTGYSAPAGASNWSNQDDVELVFYYRWKMYRGSVDSIAGNQATLDEPFFSGSALGPFGLVDQNAGVRWAENALELLDQEGEWYLDKHADILYYKPKVGENLTGSSTVDVVLPRLETLIAGDNVDYVEFDGIRFADATWLKPNSDIGYLSVQSGVHFTTDTNYITIEDAFEGIESIPGNLTFKHSTNLVFKNNTFTNLGGVALELSTGSQSNTIFNNTFDQLSAAAIVIGHAQEHHVATADDEVKDNLIDNNLIQNTGLEYNDTSAITAVWAARTVVINNRVYNVPYSGISVGWGWGRYDVDQFAFTTDNTGKAYNTHTQQRDTLVLYNQVERSMAVSHDGGAIYNLSANMNSRVIGNVMWGAPDSNGAIYLDDGSRGFELVDNVTYNNQGPRRNFHIKGSQYHTLQNNDLSGTNSTYNPAFQSVVDAAGRQTNPSIRTIQDVVNALPARVGLPSGTTPPAAGLVIGKTATASQNSADAVKAIDGDITTFWDAGTGNRSGWLTVDLGENYAVEKVNMAFGIINSSGQINYIRNNVTFQIQTSVDGVNYTDQTFFNSTGVEGINTPSVVPRTTSYTTKQAINDLLIAGDPEVRYVRVNVSDSNGQDFGIVRMKVVGEIRIDYGTNIAIGGTASQSTTWNGNVASRAIDGNTDGDWSQNQITHTDEASQQYWDLDLGSVSQIDHILVWNRTDCCADRLKDFHVFVSDVPFTGTTVVQSQDQAGVTDFYFVGTASEHEVFAPNRTGRYVRVQLTASNTPLSLAEVQVFGTSGTPSATNLALNGTASQSSTWNGNVASRAIDGNTNGDFNASQITHTDLGSQNYWQVDLGEVKNIDNIKLWNRTDCCASRLTDFHVFVSDIPFSGTTVADSQAQTGVFDHFNAGAAGTTTDVTVNRTGRYVRVQLASTAVNGENVLMLAEVEVFGSDITPNTNLAIAGTASQSSTILGGVASRAIDGNTSGDYNASQVTHTNLGSQNYWDLDLGAVKTIADIKVWNRTDCCSSRLANFHVFVSDVPFTGNSVADSQAQANVFDFHEPGTAGTTTDVSVNRSGRYVRVQLTNTDASSGENVLSLAEVQVFGQ